MIVRHFNRLRAEAETRLGAQGPGAAFFGFLRHLVADAKTKIAIGEALLEAGGAHDGEAAEASRALRLAAGELLHRAQQTGAVRSDVELPEVYALLVGTSRAVAHAGLDGEVRTRMLAIVSAGLAPPPSRTSAAD